PHLLDNESLLARGDQGFTGAPEVRHPGRHMGEKVDGLRTARTLRPGISVIDKPQFRRLDPTVWRPSNVVRRTVVVEDVTGHRDEGQDVLRWQKDARVEVGKDQVA